jgi:hypothetical protein
MIKNNEDPGKKESKPSKNVESQKKIIFYTFVDKSPFVVANSRAIGSGIVVNGGTTRRQFESI